MVNDVSLLDIRHSSGSPYLVMFSHRRDVNPYVSIWSTDGKDQRHMCCLFRSMDVNLPERTQTLVGQDDAMVPAKQFLIGRFGTTN